jgi:hypothetical protein
MSNPIWSRLNEEIPQKLWHYTSMQGFRGIVESKTIWATDTRFLSDREESIHAHKIANELVEETPEFGDKGFPLRDNLRQAVQFAFDDGALHPDRTQFFVASFSAAEDRLSQWRGYSGQTSGVSLAFDLFVPRIEVRVNGFGLLAPCVYDLKTKKECLSHALDHYKEKSEQIWKEGPDACNPVSAEEIRKRLAMVKTGVELLQREEPQRQFRCGNTTLIPYIAYPFSADTLVDVMLGPGSDAKAIQAAEAFLKSQKISVPPRVSKIPFRPW